MCCITFVWRVVLSLHKQIMFNHMRPCQTMSTRTKVCTCAASKSYQDNYVLLLYAASPIGVCWKRALPGNQYNYDVQLHWDQYDMNQWNPAIFKQLIYIYIYAHTPPRDSHFAAPNTNVECTWLWNTQTDMPKTLRLGVYYCILVYINIY